MRYSQKNNEKKLWLFLNEYRLGFNTIDTLRKTFNKIKTTNFKKQSLKILQNIA